MGCRQNVGHSGGCGRAVQSLLPHTPHREMARNLQKSHTSLCHISSGKNHISLPTAKTPPKQGGSIPDPSFGGGSKLSCFASALGFPALLSSGAVVNNSLGGCYSPCASHPPTPPRSSAFMPFGPPSAASEE